MGACQSCLGLGRREDNTVRFICLGSASIPVCLKINLITKQAENARLLEDEMYPGGYGYGSVNNANQQQADPEDLKREREALEAICQRASEYVHSQSKFREINLTHSNSSVVDIWSTQPHLQPQVTSRSNGSTTSSRVPSNETTTPVGGRYDG